MSLNAYMGYSRNAGPEEGACLIFAHDSYEARKLAYPIVKGWLGSPCLDVAVRLLRDAPWLFYECDAKLLADGVAHVIESPETCPRCERWGFDFTPAGCRGCEDLVIE